MAKLTAKDLPALPENRFWHVSHNPKSRTNPVVVTLREDTITRTGRAQASRVGWSRALGFENTIADPEEIKRTAALVLVRVGRIDDVIGEF